MPWRITGVRSGPRCWAQAVSGHHSHWLNEAYVPVEKRDFDQRVEEIIPDLSNGHLLESINKLTELIDYVQSDTQLAEGLEACKKKLSELAKTETTFFREVQEVAGESTELDRAGDILRKKLAASAGSEIQRLKLISSAYFELAPALHLFLSAVFQRQPEETVKTALEKIPAEFLSEVLEAYKVFKEAEKKNTIGSLHWAFVELMLSCAKVASNFIGDAQALKREWQTVAAAFQVLRMPVLLDLGSRKKSRFGYISHIVGIFDKDERDAKFLLVPDIGQEFEPSDSKEKEESLIKCEDIKNYEFVPKSDEPGHKAKIGRTSAEERYFKDLPNRW